MGWVDELNRNATRWQGSDVTPTSSSVVCGDQLPGCRRPSPLGAKEDDLRSRGTVPYVRGGDQSGKLRRRHVCPRCPPVDGTQHVFSAVARVHDSPRSLFADRRDVGKGARGQHSCIGLTRCCWHRRRPRWRDAVVTLQAVEQVDTGKGSEKDNENQHRDEHDFHAPSHLPVWATYVSENVVCL